MFRKTNKAPQLDLLVGVPSILNEGSRKQYDDENHWHNQFHKQVYLCIDEVIFKVLFNETTGAPNSSISLLVGMMIIKEAFGWSDAQLFEHCRFNLLTRSALGLINMNDDVPTESTYYLLRKRIYDYQKQGGVDLLAKNFDHITRGQIKEFEVNGQSIRMDSKLIGSNIAYFSRYEVIHQTLCRFYKTLNKAEIKSISASFREQLEVISKEEPLKTLYRSTREEIKLRSQSLGFLIFSLLKVFANNTTEQYLLLQRVFDEQYKITEEQQIQLRAKEEISSSSLQSPHDPDSAYRQKGDQKVKGYSINITETASDEPLNLITSVIVGKANIADPSFVQAAITATVEVTGQTVEKVFADGGYQSPGNDKFCEKIDMVYTGIQGNASKYELEMTPDGLLVTDKKTGECIQATLAKKLKNSKEDRWKIPIAKGYYYFDQLAIRASQIRRTIKQRPIEELQKRNNVEATIFQLGLFLRNGKAKYRGLLKQQSWTLCRCLWINLVRIMNFLKQTCQRTTKIAIIVTTNIFTSSYPIIQTMLQPIRSRKYSFALFLSIIINFYALT